MASLPGYPDLPSLNRPERLTPDLLPLLQRHPLLVEPKLDGWRVLAGTQADGSPLLLSRMGNLVACSGLLMDQLRHLPKDSLLDGELVGDVLHVFDVLRLKGTDLRGLQLNQRGLLLACAFPSSIQPVVGKEYAPGDDLEALLTPVPGEEGRVLKRLDGTYYQKWYKVKFVKRLTAVLLTSEGESGTTGLYDGGTLREVSGLKIPVGLQPGSLVEVEYLAVSKHGRLVQPVFKGVRQDVQLAECTTAQYHPNS